MTREEIFANTIDQIYITARQIRRLIILTAIK